MTDRVARAGLAVVREPAEFIEDRAVPETGIAADGFWRGFAAMLADLTPRNRALLARCETLQRQIDD